MANTVPLGFKYVDIASTSPRSMESRLSIWQGPSIPLVTGRGGRLRSMSVRDVIKSSILLIVGTPIGTIYHEPEFGSAIYEILFEPNDEVLRSLAEQYIVEAITRWEPRIELYQTLITSDTNNLDVTMLYLIKELGSSETFKVNVKRYASTGSIQVVPDMYI